MHGRDFSPLVYKPEGAHLKKPMVLINSIWNYGEDFTAVLKKKEFKLLHKAGLAAWIMLRDKKYKYIRYIAGEYREELYDLETDPDELHNLAVSKKYHELLSKYRKQILEEFKDQDATFLEFLPPVKIDAVD